MVQVFFTTLKNRPGNRLAARYLQELPDILGKRITRYKSKDDALRCLLGKYLLIYGLKSIGLKEYRLDSLKYNQFGRPYFNEIMDFNISHSGDYIICAISMKARVGIDIEKISGINPEDFRNIFSVSEWSNIKQSNMCMRIFYNYWTRKEAILKAVGTGLKYNLRSLEVTNDCVCFQNSNWYLQEISVAEKYICHLSTNELAPQITIEQVDLRKPLPLY